MLFTMCLIVGTALPLVASDNYRVALPLVADFVGVRARVLFAGVPEASIVMSRPNTTLLTVTGVSCDDTQPQVVINEETGMIRVKAEPKSGCAIDVVVHIRWSKLATELERAQLSGTGGVEARATACSDGVDNDGDGLTDFPLDGSCAQAKDDDEMGATARMPLPWTHRVHPHTGCLLELNMSKDQRRVLWDEHEQSPDVTNWASHCLHSTSTKSGSPVRPLCWQIQSGGSPVPECTIENRLIADTTASVHTTSESTSLFVNDTLRFAGTAETPVLYAMFTVRNKRAVAINATLPLQFGGLQIGDWDAYGTASKMYRLRPDRGGTIERNYTSTLGCLHGEQKGCDYAFQYPLQIQVFSPLTAMGDDGPTTPTGAPPLSAALQWLTAELHPEYRGTYVKMSTLVTLAHGIGRAPLLSHALTTELGPGEQKTFSAAFSVHLTGPSDFDGIAKLLSPYHDYFRSRYGGGPNAPPTYCPQGPWSWTHGPNMAHNMRPQPYNPVTHKWTQRVKLADLMRISKGSASAMGGSGIEHVGVWATALDSSFMTISGERDEFNPVTEAIAPMITESRDPVAGIGAIDAAFRAHNSRIFWFARPCEDIVGAGISYPLGKPLVTRGTILSHTVNDLRVGHGDKERANVFKRLAYWMDSLGVSGFYLDQMGCRGSFSLLQEVYKRWPHVFIAREGATDVTALHAPQIPIVKVRQLDAKRRGMKPYNPENSLLLRLLVPDATVFAGPFDVGLLHNETLDELRKNYTAIISAQPEVSPIKPQLCELINKSYARRYRQWIAYGKKRDCPAVPRYAPPCL